jgi:hypothetical protein
MNIKGELLNSIAFFKALDPCLLVSLAPHLRPLRVDAGSIIYRKNDRANDSTN